VIVLGGQRELHFGVHDVPEPPALKINGDLAKLARTWDDSWAAWDGSSPLIIKETPIAVKYWKSIYSNLRRGSKSWTAIKQLWHSWNVCVSWSLNYLTGAEYMQFLID
jgi:hypothetical protein